MSGYSELGKELLRSMQLGICPRCLQPLPDDFEGHAIFSECMVQDAHGNIFADIALCPECYRETYNYGARGTRKHLREYWYGKPIVMIVDNDPTL